MLKTFFRYSIIIILRLEARLVLYRYRPKIVAITGSVGKTSAKDAIALALATVASVRQSPKSYNSEIGVPLTILGVDNAWQHPIGWLKNIFHGFHLIIFKTPYPQWLVLEVGADRVGDIRSLARWLHPHVAVLTSLSVVPAHVEFFSSPEAVFKEKSSLLLAVRQGGAIVINEDDERIVSVTQKLIAQKKLVGRKIIRLGSSKSAEIRLIDHFLQTNKAGEPNGLMCKIDYAGYTTSLELPELYGTHQLYAILMALGVTFVGGYPLMPVIEALAKYGPPPGRGRLLAGVKGSFILDDSYNASPQAVVAALETLKNFPSVGRKIAVLGDMLELGTYTIDAHREIGQTTATICDLLITVGVRAKFIGEGALDPPVGGGLGKKKLRHFNDALEAGQALQSLLKSADVILVKGSQAVRLEKVVEEIMAEPERKGELLCRQEAEWLKR